MSTSANRPNHQNTCNNHTNFENLQFFCKECFDFICSKCRFNHICSKSFCINFENIESELTIIYETLKPKLDVLPDYTSTGISNLPNIIKSFQLFLNQGITYTEAISKYNLDEIKQETEGISKEWKNYSLPKEKNKKEIINMFTRHKDGIIKCNSIAGATREINKNIQSFFKDCIEVGEQYNIEENLRVEKYIMANNSNLSTIIKSKFEKVNNKFYEDLEMGKKENQQLKEEILSLKTIASPYNRIENQSSQLNSSPKHDINRNINKDTGDIIDFSSSTSHLGQTISTIGVDHGLTESHVKKIDEYDIKGFIKIPYNDLIKSLDIQDLSSEYFNEFASKYIDEKYFIDELKCSPVYKQYTNELDQMLERGLIRYITKKNNNGLNNIDHYTCLKYINSSKLMSGIKIIDFKNCEIRDIHIDKIVSIVNLGKVTELFLQSNKLTDNGMKVYFESGSERNKLKNMYFTSNDNITSKSLMYLKNVVEKNKNVFTSGKIVSFENNNCSKDKDKVLSKEYVKEIKKMLKITGNI